MQTIDGVAARIEDGILAESEVRELAAFQKLVDGQAKPREELLRELEDQWIVHGEAPGKWPLAGGVLILVATAARTLWDAKRRRR